MKDNDKVTLTFGQIKRLISESNKLSKTFRTNVKNYIETMFGEPLETLDADTIEMNGIYEEVIDQYFDGDSEEFLNFLNKYSNKSFVLKEWIDQNKGHFGSFMQQFTLGGITFNIFLGDATQAEYWFDGSEIYMDDFEDKPKKISNPIDAAFDKWGESKDTWEEVFDEIDYSEFDKMNRNQLKVEIENNKARLAGYSNSGTVLNPGFFGYCKIVNELYNGESLKNLKRKYKGNILRSDL